MKNSVKLATTVFLTGTLCITFLAPAFAQNYQSKYTPKYAPANPGYNQGYQQQYPQGYSQGYQSYPQGYNQGYNNMPQLQGRVITIPAGTVLSAATTSTLSSQSLTVGDTVAVRLGSDFYYNGVLIIPGGSSIEGNVVVAERAGLAGKNGKLKIHFTNAVMPNGQRIPVSGKLATDDGTGMISGGTTMGRVGEVVKDTAVGGGLGALAGTILGPLSGGKVGKGAIYGTAIGGGLGLTKSVIDKGNDASIPANSQVNIILDQPATVTPGQNYSY